MLDVIEMPGPSPFFAQWLNLPIALQEQTFTEIKEQNDPNKLPALSVCPIG